MNRVDRKQQPDAAIGLVLYHDTPLYQETGFLDDLLTTRGESGSSLEDALDTATYFESTASRKARRHRAVLPTAFARIATGELSGVVLCSETSRSNATTLELTIDCATERHARTETLNPWLYLFMLVAGREVLSPAAAARLGCSVAEKTSAKAGVLVSMDTAGIVDYLHLAPNEEWLTPDEVSRIEAESPGTFGDKIRGPEWGTFLNEGHVATLGGQEAIAVHPSVYQLERLPFGGAYLQVTERPEELETADGRARIAALRTFLAPVMHQDP